jgi:hypothetical protein
MSKTERALDEDIEGLLADDGIDIDVDDLDLTDVGSDLRSDPGSDVDDVAVSVEVSSLRSDDVVVGSNLRSDPGDDVDDVAVSVEVSSLRSDDVVVGSDLRSDPGDDVDDVAVSVEGSALRSDDVVVGSDLRSDPGDDVDDVVVSVGGSDLTVDESAQGSDLRSDPDDVDSAIDDEPYVLPQIVMATEEDDEFDDDTDEGADVLVARRLPGEALVAADLVPTALDPGVEEPSVSDDVLEELRRADIDGPTVELAPQDETSSGLRRPRRAPDYDPAPYPIPLSVPRLLGRKPRVRRVTRVVRHVDPWSVFKIAIVANLLLYVILLTAGVLLWNVAYATGTVDNVERFFESFGWSSFEFSGGEIYHNAWIGGLFVVIGLTGLAVLLATMFNLITDLVGGMRFTVLEEEVVETRTSPMRRFVVRRPEPEVPVELYDESGPLIRESVVDDSGRLPR